MKAAFIQQTGTPDVIQYGDLPDPSPAAGQVLVRVRSVAVNPVDTYIRGGADYWELPSPFIIGCDLAGVVEAVGDQVTEFQVGDRVWCTNQGLVGRQGTFAELAVVDACWLYPLPNSVDFDTAAASALVGVTAHLGLFREAEMADGKTVFVQGGSGGVGSMVVQMAKAAGGRVIASAGSAAKAEICRELGADAVVNYREQQIANAVLAFSPAGVNIFWETQREPDFDLAVEVLAERGRMILMAGRDARPEFPVGPFYVKELSLHGFVMFKATPEEMRRCADDMNRWFEAGRLKARIDRVMPLSQAAEAHRLQEASTVEKSGQLAGKIVLHPCE